MYRFHHLAVYLLVWCLIWACLFLGGPIPHHGGFLVAFPLSPSRKRGSLKKRHAHFFVCFVQLMVHHAQLRAKVLRGSLHLFSYIRLWHSEMCRHPLGVSFFFKGNLPFGWFEGESIGKPPFWGVPFRKEHLFMIEAGLRVAQTKA